MRANRFQVQWLWLVLLIGLALRLAYALEQPTLIQYTGATGGDSSGYLARGAGFFSGKEHGWIRGIPFYISNIKIAPLYIIFAGLFQPVLPDHETIVAIRLVQCLASIATAYLAFRIAAVIACDARAGIAAAALMAFHPAFIIEPANIATETLYITFLALGLWLYVEYVASPVEDRRRHRLAATTALTLAGCAFGLATLTRGVSALFPAVLALHLMCLGRRRLLVNWRRAVALLLLVYAAMVSSWTLYNLLNWNRFIIVSDQLMPALWRGAERDDGSPEQNDKLLLEGVDASTPEGCEIDCKFEHATGTYVAKIGAIISGDPAGFVALRLGELAYAILQPYGTTPFGDISIGDALRHWLLEDRSLAGLAQVSRIEGFAIKLAVWIFHYAGIGFGALGLLLCRKRWIRAAPLAGFILYTVAAHLFLLALPRYLFPIEFAWLVFAGVALCDLMDRWRKRERGTGDNRHAQ